LSLIREIPPTAGWPLHFKTLALAFFNTAKKAAGLENDFKNYLNAPYAKTVYSGTAAFYLILESLKYLSAKKTVIIPAFACPLIPLAIQRAGFKIQLCDINRDNFDFDLAKLKSICAGSNDILAILAVHLGGLPIDLASLNEIAKSKQAFVIEDCAQSLGAAYPGKPTGSLGDFSFFSLCRGKGLTIYEGGVIVANKPELAASVDITVKKLVKNDPLSECLKILELFAYWIFYRPKLFWFAYRLPQIYWQFRHNPVRAWGEYFTTDFPTHNVSNFRKAIGHIDFSQLNGRIIQQQKQADLYLKRLNDLSGIRTPRSLPGASASYPYLTLIFDDPQKRDLVLRKLQNSGLGLSRIYLSALPQYDYLKNIIGRADCPQAGYLAERALSLSTNVFLKPETLESLTKTIIKLTG